MKRILAYVTFFSVFFAAYLAMHYYIFARLAILLDISRNVWFHAFVIILALSFPAVSLLERFVDGRICRLFYTLAATWLGASFLMFCLVLVHDALSLFFSIDGFAASLSILTLTLVLVVFGLMNASVIRVRQVSIPVPGLRRQVSIVHLSDIHLGTIHDSNYLAGIVRKTNALRPDLVLITGDFVDGSGRIDSHTVAPLKELGMQVFFSTGNHEDYEGITAVTRLLRAVGVKILRNAKAEHQGLQIIGIDNPGEGVKDENKELRRMKVDGKRPSILMFHPPLGLDDAIRSGITLQLSGHTHAGQIMPFNIFTRMFYRYTSGLYEKDGTYLYVSPGTGTWGPPMRIGSNSEITLIRLVKSKKQISRQQRNDKETNKKTKNRKTKKI